MIWTLPESVSKVSAQRRQSEVRMTALAQELEQAQQATHATQSLLDAATAENADLNSLLNKRDKAFEDAQPVEVTLTKGYWIGKYEMLSD